MSKLNPSASGTASLLSSTFLGGNSDDYGYGIAVDEASEVYIVGGTPSTDFPTRNAYQSVKGADFDAFVTKMNFTAVGPEALLYSTFLGGGGDDSGNGVAVDGSGYAYVAGYTLSTDFPTRDAFQTDHLGGGDAFVAKLDPSAAGSASLRYASYLGGGLDDAGQGIAVDDAGSAYVTGTTASSLFPTVPTPFQGNQGGFDAFVTKVAASSVDTVGVYAPSSGAWFLRNANSPGVADLAFGYGPAAAGWIPLVGDWNGDGQDTPGLYNTASGVFFLRNAHAGGPADLLYGFGPAGAGWLPLSGDWDGDGTDTIGLYNPSSGVFFLRNAHGPGPAHLAFSYGPAGQGWRPLAGDWDGNGTDTPGLYAPTSSFFFLKNSNSSGPADLAFAYGPAAQGWTPLSGDWDADGTDSVGLHAPTTGVFFLKNSNTSGPGDLAFGYGTAGATPLAGDWDGR